MSLPTPGIRIDAMYKLNPSRDSIGQPSLTGLFTSRTGVATLQADHSSCDACGPADATKRAKALMKHTDLIIFMLTSNGMFAMAWAGPTDEGA
jgi:hypothetical protein